MLLVGRVHLDGVTADPEAAPTEHLVVAVELQVHQPPQDAAHVVVDPHREVDHDSSDTLANRGFDSRFGSYPLTFVVNASNVQMDMILYNDIYDEPREA